MGMMPSPLHIDGINFRRWHGFSVLFIIIVIIRGFDMWFQQNRNIAFLPQLVEDAPISDTTDISSITTERTSKTEALSRSTPSSPYNPSAGNFEEENMQYVATVKEEVFTRPDPSPATPNFFEILKQKDCLPVGGACLKCLTTADCRVCRKACGCFCNSLCREKIESKFVSKQLTVTLPSQTRDSNRLIPRIVHQTWYKEIDPKKYPKKNRLVQSFRSSGWEHRFYTDDESGSFLSTHFPPEVREAYDILLPGAYKADLFRYCALLIHGGLYADVDILLESNLDISVGPDIGFIAPFDKPGRNNGKGMCLWNGFMAAAPGHPYLAQAIETVVNQVRNRFTSVDIDANFCPSNSTKFIFDTSVLHSNDDLFTSGPCLLGASLNRVLRRDLQTQFDPGDVQMPAREVDGSNETFAHIPGRTVILQQSKKEMGAHRFIHRDLDLIVAGTDFPKSEDDPATIKKRHYRYIRSGSVLFGLNNVYRDQEKANEDILIKVIG
jgi:hypothetical protein